MYQRILVPIDGSAPSQRGLQEAIGLARTTGGSLKLVHVVNEFVFATPYAPPQTYKPVIESMRVMGQSILETAATQVSKAGVPFQSTLIETIGGGVAKLILEAADEWPADLIVMGTHGRRGVRRVVLGSDAELVLRTAKVPVLLVRDVPEDGDDRSR